MLNVCSSEAIALRDGARGSTRREDRQAPRAGRSLQCPENQRRVSPRLLNRSQRAGRCDFRISRVLNLHSLERLDEAPHRHPVPADPGAAVRGACYLALACGSGGPLLDGIVSSAVETGTRIDPQSSASAQRHVGRPGMRRATGVAARGPVAPIEGASAARSLRKARNEADDREPTRPNQKALDRHRFRPICGKRPQDDHTRRHLVKPAIPSLLVES